MAREAKKEIPKVTTNLTVEKIGDGYADCNVRLTVVEREEGCEKS